MVETPHPLDRLQQLVEQVEGPVASEMKASLEEARRQLRESERKARRLSRAQAEAIVHSAEIIRELEETQQQLDGARLAAEEATRTKSELLANMSHEIRTPMTAILGFSDLMLDPNITQDEKARAIQTIQRNGRHLLEMINDILDLSKVEAGQLEVQHAKCSTVQLLRDVRDLLSVRAKKKGIRLETGITDTIPDTIGSDPTRLRQALLNLAGNAVKFTDEGCVRVVAECNRQKQLLTFHVIDTGIGIAPDQLMGVFEPFSQADSSTTRRFGGTGLGLAITRQIAALLGGTVTAKSKEGEGSTFSLTVPTGSLAGVRMVSSLDRESDLGVPRSTKQGARLSGPVLLVEDGPDNQRLIAFVLKKAGADVTVAENGKAGVEAALAAWEAGKPFGVILMDIQMPVMDGYEATGKLRAAGYDGQIVALTAHAMKGEIDRCLAAGCDACLSKPIDRALFIAEVAHRMGKRSELAPMS